jgi:peroxiredoxin (alkyl hydroperoxide reductase subunit C)
VFFRKRYKMSNNHDSDSCCYNDCHCDCECCRNRIPRIGEEAPEFVANTTQGEINFPRDFKGKWIILFSHPADFTPVCTTEFMTFGSMMKEFEDLNVQLVGLSVDSIYAHIAWLRKIQEIEWNGMKNIEITFPLIEDITMEVSRKYGMIQSQESKTQAVRAVFFIDPSGIVRAMINYPQSLGRNFDEIKRVILALQKADADNVATPANWRPGDDVIMPAPGSCGTAKDRVETKEADKICYDWFLCFKKDKPSAPKKKAGHGKKS